jgi:hypothetical protein
VAAVSLRFGAARPTDGHHGTVSTTSTPSPPPTPGGGYALRSVVVADSLDDLRGPVHGHVRLPLHLDASARQSYDLDQDYFRRLVYRLVLLEAATVEDLTTWLDRDTLVHEWPELYLPRVVRAAWEQRHPQLRDRGAGPHVPRS